MLFVGMRSSQITRSELGGSEGWGGVDCLFEEDLSGNAWISIGTLTLDRRAQRGVNMELLEYTIEVNVEVSFVVNVNSL